MVSERVLKVADTIGRIPYRMALAGGWIDQPFVSRLTPAPPGSMVVVGLEPTCRFMDRAGMATSTRRIAEKMWDRGLPEQDPMALVRELYKAENNGKTKPSRSQDMAAPILSLARTRASAPRFSAVVCAAAI